MNTWPILLAPHGSSVLFFYQNIMLRPYVGLSLIPCFDINYGPRLDELELPAHVQKYCCDTKKRYTDQPVLPESDWPPTLGGQYIQLALIKQGPHDLTHRKVVALQEDYVRGRYDKILQRKTEIKLEEIFNPIFCQGGYKVPQLKMLIDGAPGVGKTTLSRNVSRKWAEGQFLQEYWLVLLLHLRERDISRAQTIDEFFYHADQMVQDSIATFVKERSGRGVLLIFDGFDELSFDQRHKQSLFLDIVEGKILNECSVVITSRPYASRPVQRLKSVDRHVEVLGFTNKQIHECIKQGISDGAKAEELCAELEDRLDIESICQIPLNCSIVLYVYEQEEYRLPDTLTELFELFVLHSLRRHTTRAVSASAAERLRDLKKLPSEIQDYFNILSELANSSLKEDKLVFEEEELEQALSKIDRVDILETDAPILDLMTSAKSYSKRGTHYTYSFLHLTIQEYLGAFWAANNLSDKEKLDFLRENLKEERFYMTLWFFAGMTKLDIPNVHSIFNNDLWKYDNHVHICHLLYESDSNNHSHCGYVAENCVSNKEMSFVHGGFRGNYEHSYSRFDRLMIAHFLAHSQCQWNRLTLHLDDVKILHKVFNGLRLCGTSILQVVINVGNDSIATFHEGVISMLDEIPQFNSVRISFELDDPSMPAVRGIKGNIKNAIIKIKTLKSLNVEILGNNKNEVTRIFYDELIEGIAHNGSLVQDLKLQSVSVQDIEYLISLLTKWNHKLKLVNLSVSKKNTHFCRQEKQCCEFYKSLSTFLSKNSSLKKIIISPPFDDCHLGRYTDTIQSAFDQNSTLEEFNIRDKFVFQRNKHTSKLELVRGHKFLHSYSLVNQPEEGLCRMPSGNSESLCTESGSESDDDDDDVESFQASSAKRQKVGTSSACQATLVHVQSELNPQQPQPSVTMAVFSSSQMSTLTHSPLCQSLYFSQCATVSPQLQPVYCMAGSSSTQGTHLSLSKNRQIPSQEQRDFQSQSGNITSTQLPHMGLIPWTMVPYPMAYQQPSREICQYYHINPSFNYHTTPYHAPLHTGMNPPRNIWMMPPANFPPITDHALQYYITSEPEQYRPATAPPVPMSNPNTGGASSTTSEDSPLPATSTST